MIELLGDSEKDFRSSILLTYSLDLPLYDGLVRRVLRKAGIWNQIALCDFRCFVQESDAWHAAPFAGTHYSVTPIWQPTGAFHPKVYLLLGPRHGRLLIGSGNATVGGLLRNAETFGVFNYDAEGDTGPHTAFSAVLGFIEELGQQASRIVGQQLASARQMAPWLDLESVDDGRQVLITGPEKPGILDQVAALLPVSKADDLVVCSSSFDRALDGARRLASISKSPPRLIVQPDYAAIDGASVKRLGDRVDWLPFVDPYPKEKRRRRDVKAHAKILIFGHGQTETCVFGSANASAPALLGGNTEVVVALPHRKKGTTATQLGLVRSLKAKSVREELTYKTWEDSQDPPPETKFVCLLSAVVETEVEYQLTLAHGKLPHGAALALSDRWASQPVLTTMVKENGSFLLAPRSDGVEGLRSAWLLDRSGRTISNAVFITSSTVARPRRHGGGAVAAEYLSAMKDGEVLGTVLFEVLDRFRNFEVIHIRSVGRADKGQLGHEERQPEERPAEYFYTDAPAHQLAGHSWMQDRTDLDILASLVQPLSPAGSPESDEDDSYDDSRLDEEAEYRQINEQGGLATGKEKPQRIQPSSDTFRKVIRRLVRRLERAATSLEDSLEHLKDLQDMAPNGIARQVWMTHIGAFLTGKKTSSKEDEEFICLDPLPFAAYVLRVARALVGSKRAGGFLDKLSANSFEGYDGESLRRGLAFLWTCVEWAAAYTVYYYSQEERKDEFPTSIAVASSELVAARFIAKVGPLCRVPDHADLVRRFPGYASLPSSVMQITSGRISTLVQLIQDVEIREDRLILLGESSIAQSKAGTLVYNPVTGITVLAKDADRDTRLHLVDFSKAGNESHKFAAKVYPVLASGSPWGHFPAPES